MTPPGSSRSDARTPSRTDDDGALDRYRGGLLRWLVLLSPLVVPWVVVRTNQTTLLFPWGTVVLETAHLSLVGVFVDQPGPTLPYVRYWLFAAGCYFLALLWAAMGPRGADQRVTAGLFVLVAISAAFLAAEFSVDLNRTGYPVATLHAFVVAIWVYRSRRTDGWFSGP